MLQADANGEQPQTLEAGPGTGAVEQAISQVMARMFGIELEKPSVSAALGPTPTSGVHLDGVPTTALLDTGSPVSIVSLDHFLSVAVANRKPNQPKEEWKREVQQRLQPPSISLRSYGGAELEVVGQSTCRLSKGKFSIDVVLQIQKEPPVELLLGTDVLPQLGFSLTQCEADHSNPTDLLHTQPHTTPKHANTDQLETQDSAEGRAIPSRQAADTAPPAVVKLMQATRLPARHSKMVRIKIEGACGDGTCLFEPELQSLGERGLTMADAVVGVGDGGGLTMVVTNQGTTPVQLEVGEVLGELQPASIVLEGGLADGKETETETHVGAAPSTPSRVQQTEGGPQKITHVAAVQSKSRREREEQLLEALKLENADLPQRQLHSLVEEFADLFALNSSELGCTSVVTHEINTGEHCPVRQHPCRVPFSLRGKVCELIKEMLDQGVVVPSASPWASPIVLVAKKDGSTRFCMDYRRLNAVTKLGPLPRIDDSLDLLADAKFFTSLDLASGYWQVGMSEESREKTAFTTHAGLFEFTVMPFGLCNAPATFQRLMENVLMGLTREKCLVYLDDVLVLGRTFSEHLGNLREVFSRLHRAGLKLKPSKCKLGQKHVVYLGYVVSAQGISTDPSKVVAITQFPRPVDLKSLRSFLGLTSYYRRFVPRFSSIAEPLYSLTRKDTPYEWSPKCEAAFVHLKRLLTESPVLAYPHFGHEFLLETDASGVGLGAVLSQEDENKAIRPIAFASRTLLQHEKKYGISELEALAVVWAVKHFRHYLYGYRCIVFMDHEALKSLLKTPQPSGKLARWGMALQELDLRIEWKSNARADVLSRYPVSLLLHDCPETVAPTLVAAMEAPRTLLESGEGSRDLTLRERQCKDTHLKPIIDYLETGDLPQDEKQARELVISKELFIMEDDVLYRVERDKSLRFVPPSSDRRKLFDEAHSGKFAGHLREAKIHSVLARHYWWPGMRADITSWCRACLPCATRSVGKSVRPPLTPIPVGGPFDRVGVDVLQLPKTSRGNRYAVVFVDYLTKWPEVYATRDQSAPTIAKLLVEEVISRHGVPRQLLSDRGASFLSRLMLEVCSVMGVKKINTSAYHPQTDGLVERYNRTLTNMLAKTVAPDVEWDDRLPYVLFAYRVTQQASTGESPFFLLYGRLPCSHCT